jgi:hypothetical protein
VFLLTRTDDTIAARVMTMVAVYSAIGLRDERLNADLGKAMMGGPVAWQAVKRLRRDAHAREASCWLHAATCCLST